MKALFLTLIFTFAVTAQAESAKPMTLKCDISYSRWNSLNDPVDPSQRVKLPVNQVLKKNTEEGRHRYEAEVTQTTEDGRYEITTEAFQPLKGDMIPQAFVRIHIKDKKSNLVIQDAYPHALAPKKDILFASQLLSWNFDEKNPDQPGSQLKAVCVLK